MMQNKSFMNQSSLKSAQFKLVIFDLDDTLIDTSQVFHESRSGFATIMEERGIPSDVAIEVFEEIDGENFAKYGVSPMRYGASMKLACERLLGIPDRSTYQNLATKIDACAAILTFVYPRIIAGAIELLTWCKPRFKLALMTRGFDELQNAKIEAAGIRAFFETIRVVPKKGEAEFASLIAELNYSPQDTWIVGDSIKSDINPGLVIGAKCIWYEYKHPHYHWQQEHTDTATGPHFHASSLNEVRQILDTHATAS